MKKKLAYQYIIQINAIGKDVVVNKILISSLFQRTKKDILKIKIFIDTYIALKTMKQ